LLLPLAWTEPADAQLGAIRRKAEEAPRKIDSASKKKAEDSARARPDSTKSGGAAPASSTVTGAQAPASTAPAPKAVIGPPSGVNEMVSVEGGAQVDRGATSGNHIWNPYYTSIEGSGSTGATTTVKLPEAVVSSVIGDTKPSAPNGTAAGRAQNRRVEVVKQ
jgi:hypothetical protein